MTDRGDLKGVAGAAAVARAAAVALALADSRVLMLWRDSGEESVAFKGLSEGFGIGGGVFYLETTRKIARTYLG